MQEMLKLRSHEINVPNSSDMQSVPVDMIRELIGRITKIVSQYIPCGDPT